MNEHQYIAAVRRRLNLPREIKDRVISDLTGTIAQRREAGQSEQEIFAELGSPKAVAAELNGQMEEYAYRKSPWRFLFLAVALLSSGWLLLRQLLVRVGLLLETLHITVSPAGDSASIGVIGGSDGPTAIFVATEAAKSHIWNWEVLLVAAILAVSIAAFLRLRKCRQS